MKVFLIQSPDLKTKLANDLGIPETKVNEINPSQIIVQEHYFCNILRKYFPEKNIKETIELFFTDTEEKWALFDELFEKSGYEVFEYEVI